MLYLGKKLIASATGAKSLSLKEDLANKSTNLNNPNDKTYPTTNAVSTSLLSKAGVDLSNLTDAGNSVIDSRITAIMDSEVPVRTEYDVPMLVNTLRWRKYTFPSGLKIMAGRVTSKEDGFYDITFPSPFTVPPTAYLTTDYSATVTAKDVPLILWYGSKDLTTTSIRVYANSSLIQEGITVYASLLLIGY